MNKSLSIALLTAGIVLIVYGVNALDSFGSDLSRFFTGAPTDQTVWLLLGGAAATAAGLAGLFRGPRV